MPLQRHRPRLSAAASAQAPALVAAAALALTPAAFATPRAALTLAAGAATRAGRHTGSSSSATRRARSCLPPLSYTVSSATSAVAVASTPCVVALVSKHSPKPPPSALALATASHVALSASAQPLRSSHEPAAPASVPARTIPRATPQHAAAVAPAVAPCANAPITLHASCSAGGRAHDSAASAGPAPTASVA